MLYLMQGSAAKLYNDFGASALIEKARGGKETALKDLPRSSFFGNAEDCKWHMEEWSNLSQEQAAHYAQGNMTAGNLFTLLHRSLFLGQDEDPSLWAAQLVNICFAYLDENKSLSGFALYYRKDQPQRWMLGLIKNTKSLPEQREVLLLTSFDPRIFCTSLDEPLTLSREDVVFGNFTKKIALVSLENFVRQVLLPQGQINTAAEAIELFLQPVPRKLSFKANEPLLAAFAQRLDEILASPFIQKLVVYDLKPSPSQLMACLDCESELYRLLSAIANGEGGEEDKHYQLGMLLKLDELGLNARQTALRSTPAFARRLSGMFESIPDDSLCLWLADELKTKGLQFLCSGSAESTLYFKLIKRLQGVQESAFWQTLAQLADLRTNKPQDDFAHVFVCAQLLDSPRLPITLLEKRFLSLQREMSVFPILPCLINPLRLAEFLQVETEEEYQAKLRNFCAFFAFIQINYAQATGLAQASMPSLILKQFVKRYLRDPQDSFLAFLHASSELAQVKACYNLIELGCKKELIEFISHNTNKSQQFCRLILRVESECSAIRQRLSREAETKYQKLCRPELEYRRSVYQALYEVLQNPDGQAPQRFVESIKEAETKFLAIVNEDRHPWLRRVLMVLANMLSLALGGVANLYHKQTCGDFLFFYRPASAQAFNQLRQEIWGEVQSTVLAV